jgi:uncharacterized membrane protein
MDLEHKKKFALERLVLFSDAVFAIAITLLVIELRLPEMKEMTSAAMRESLVHMIPHFFSFFLSFFIIGIYWVAHHRTFTYVVNYDSRLLWLNLVLLCFIALMPFSSNVYGVYGNVNTAFYLYTANITTVALFNFLLYRHIANLKKKLSHGLEDPRLVRYYTLRAWAVPFCFLIGVILALIISDRQWSLFLSRTSPVLIWPAMAILRKRFADVVPKAMSVA